MAQAQRVEQISSQLMNRQYLLTQLDNTFAVLGNYFASLRGNDRELVGGQNVLACGSMNTLQMQASLALMDNDSDVLLMALAKTAEFEGHVGREFELDLQENRELNAVKQNYFGFMRAVLTGKDVPQLPAVPMTTDAGAANRAFGKLLASVHEIETSEEDVRKNPSVYADEQSRLLALAHGHGFDRASFDTRFNMDQMCLHFTRPKKFYEGGSKPFAGPARVSVNELGEPDLMDEDTPLSGGDIRVGQTGRVELPHGGWADVVICEVLGDRVKFQYVHERRTRGKAATVYKASKAAIDIYG